MRPDRRLVLRLLGFALAWLAVAAPAWVLLFTTTSERLVVASHDATVRPTLDGHVRLILGPYLPDLRLDAGGRVGVVVDVGKTTARESGEIVERYAALAARPAAEERRVRAEVVEIARDQVVQAALIGLAPIGLWLLVGPRRRAELWRRPDRRRLVLLASGVVVVVLLAAQPWEEEPARVQPTTWIPVQQALPDLTVPAELAHLEVQGGVVTRGTQRLLASMFDTYDRSRRFYDGVLERVPAAASTLHAPAEGETVAVLVADRHDNIGMDEVVRAVADEAGATVVLDAGDDTSTGQPWEEFSLESLDSAFEDYDARVFAAGNHDNGTFVPRYLESLGWTHLEGEVVEPFADVRINGVDDPRASGLGTWRDETDLSFAEVEERLTEDVCELDAAGERVATLLVHDADLGETALERGCVDLVLGGHVHAQIGPDRVVGANGKAGYRYTNGTTGGAAYAIAVGSKLRRDAQFTLVTYAEGRPVGLQPVTVTTRGLIRVDAFLPLDVS